MRPSLGRRDALAALILVLLGVGLPLSLSIAAGAVGIPTVDDWVYMRGAASLFMTGTIDMPGHTAAAIGQLFMVQPFLAISGGNPWAFTAFGLVMTSVVILATYLLARRFVGTGSAAMVVLLVVAFPGFARVSASFMTDIPAYALAMLCLLFGTIWLDDGKRSVLIFSLGLGLLAISVREFALAAPTAVLLISWVRSDAKGRLWLAAASTLFFLGVAGILYSASQLPGHAVPQTPGGLGRVVLVIPAAMTLAAVLIPVLVVAIGRQIRVLTSAQVFTGVGIASLAFVAPWGTWTGGGGNFWTPFGFAGDGLLRGERGLVFGETPWALSGQVAWIAGMLLATLLSHWLQHDLGGLRSLSVVGNRLDGMARSAGGLLGSFILIYASGLVAFAAAYGVWDRYLYPLVPTAAILILRYRPEPFQFGRSVAFSHAGLGWLAVSAVAIATNSFAFDAARWRAGQAAVVAGYDAQTIDAGYEWVGYHATGGGGQGTGDRGQAWFEYLMAPAPICVVVSNSPPGADEPLLDEGLEPLDGNYVLLRKIQAAYRQYLFVGDAQPLYLYGGSRSGCPSLVP